MSEEQNIAEIPRKTNGKKWGIIAGIAIILIAVIAGIGIYNYNTPANKIARHLSLGNRYLEEQNFEQAIVEFDEVIQIDPMSVDAYLGKAQAYEGMGDIDMALQTLEKGYEVTGDERILEALTSLQPENVLKEILVLDGTYEDYRSAYGGSIPVQKNGMWGAINYDNEVIVPFEYAGFWQAPDNLGNFVLYNSDFTEQTYGETTYTVESREYFLFDNQGNVLYRGEDGVRASGGMYITEHVDYEEDISLIEYHRLDGTVLVSWECSWYDTVLNGFYDGISNLYDSLSGPMRIGTVDQQGNLSWKEDPYYYIREEEDREKREAYARSQGRSSEDNSDGIVGSASAMDNMPLLSTTNHGYYVTDVLYIDGLDLMMYDSDGNRVASVNCSRLTIDGNGVVSIDENVFNSSNGCNRYWADGFYYYNYGTKMVLIVNDKYVLVDLAKNTAGSDSVSMNVVIAVYDYIGMADEKYWLVQSGEQWGYIDHDGSEMAMFEDASDFAGGYALVIEDGEAWLIDEEFNKLESLGQADGVGAWGELYGVRTGDDLHLYQLQ